MPDLTREQILKMEAGPELNALIATEVMGWKHVSAGYYWAKSRVPGGLAKRKAIVTDWSPSTDPSADYEVLVFVRENWDSQKFQAFQRCLLRVLYKHTHMGMTESEVIPDSDPWDGFWFTGFYQPGDYSRSALLTTLPAKDGHTNEES